MGLGSLLQGLAWLLRPLTAPRVVRRAGTHCPHTGELVEVDVLMTPTGDPAEVLRCSGRPECPPSCDGACSRSAESMTGPAHALFICPPGSGAPEEID
jgi:hypothetical protein